MRTSITSAVLALALLTSTGCGKGKSDGAPAAPTGDGKAASSAGPQDNLVKLSQFGDSLYCSVVSSPDGTIHAIYTDRPNALKPSYIYYRSSKDNGATWTEAKNLSDDESGLSSYYCRVVVDGKGQVYGIWKYLTAASDTLDGPGSASCGIIAYRCLDAGGWSKTVRLCDKHVPGVSYFATNAPDGTVHIVWSQGNHDIDWEKMGGPGSQNANQVNQTILDGASQSTKAIIAPKRLPTQQEQDAAKAAGHYMTFEETSVRRDGLWSLRGYIDKAGVPHFVGDHYPIPKDEYNNSGPNVLMYYDGKTVNRLADQKNGIQFNNPSTLLVDASGKEHLIRQPPNSEKDCVRDYSIANNALVDPVDIVAPDATTGSVVDWQATQLPGGKMAVTVALSQKGGWSPDDTELYISTRSGDGKWSKPADITNNAARQAFMSKETSAGGVMKSDSYRPDFAETTLLKDGSLGVLMVNTDKSIIGITNSGVTSSGRTVGSLATGSTSAPWVFFARVK